MTKLYFSSTNDEMCYPLEYHIEEARENGQSEIILYNAEPEKVDGMFYCKAMGVAMEEIGYCGISCEDYTPRNGKFGICKHKGKFFNKGETTILINTRE